MIVHRIGTDSRLAFDWVDVEGNVIEPDSASFTVDDDAPWTLADDGLNIDPEHSLRLHLADDLDIAAGNHQYRLTATSDDDTVLLSGGLLRIQP